MCPQNEIECEHLIIAKVKIRETGFNKQYNIKINHQDQMAA